MSSFCNCAISLTNCKFYWIFKVGLRHVLYVMYVKPYILCLYLPTNRSPVVSKLHSIREQYREKRELKKVDTNNEFTLDRFKLVNKMT